MKKLKTSPWGAVQHESDILPGMIAVSTAGHGGIWVSAERLALMPKYMQSTGYSRDGWFEEDCDWCLPFVVFAAEILRDGPEKNKSIISTNQHLDTFVRWHPERAAKWMAAQQPEVTK